MRRVLAVRDCAWCDTHASVIITTAVHRHKRARRRFCSRACADAARIFTPVPHMQKMRRAMALKRRAVALDRCWELVAGGVTEASLRIIWRRAYDTGYAMGVRRGTRLALARLKRARSVYEHEA